MPPKGSSGDAAPAGGNSAPRAWLEPGGLRALSAAGADEWRVRLDGLFRQRAAEGQVRLVAEPDERTPHRFVTDWTGLPVRVVSCLGRDTALALMDAPGEHGDEGRRRLQEEYVEWRCLRGPDGALRRVELTTELPEHWTDAAAHDPAAMLETVALFAREDRVDPTEVFAGLDPFAERTSPIERAEAFTRTMLSAEGSSPYNRGGKAICCMIHPTNTLAALASLVREALRTWTVPGCDGTSRRCLSADDVIPLMHGAAVPGRASDPVLTERLTRLAWDGRLVAYDDPVGVYVQGVEYTRLRTPRGEPVPSEWFVFSRGMHGRDAPDGRARWQRVVFEVPNEEGFSVGDLVDVATECPLLYGGQVAELVQVAFHMRASESGVLPPEPAVATPPAGSARTDPCADLRAHHQSLA